MPLPLEAVSAEDAARAFFPDGDPDPSTPLGTAYVWGLSSNHYPSASDVMPDG